ncbi:MAG TPA: DUF1579 domain-containing protein [Phycisphaerae bacterium]|nr:DUF1579 domain-containing protein [Phycisphaerae bacterium]
MTTRMDRKHGMAARVLPGVLVVAAAVALLAGRAVSQDKGPKAEKEGANIQKKEQKGPGKNAGAEEKGAASKGPSEQEMAEMMKRWAASATPGEHHKLLEPFVGTWDITVRSMMNGPDAPPSEFKGMAEVKWILDGRYIEENLKCEMPMPDEKGGTKKMDFTGRGWTGYDNFKNKYVATWIDNMSTQVMLSKGDADPKGKVFTFYAEVDEPVEGKQEQMLKTVARIIDKDKHVFEMYNLSVSEKDKIMEITYTRK